MASAILSIAKNALMRSICAGITVTGNIIPQEMPGLSLNAKLYFKFRLSLFRCLSCLLCRNRCRNGESEQLIHD
jgi:hypothetical protein